jgi:hypothetical protein
MPNYTIPQLRAVGIAPAGTDAAGGPGPIIVEFEFDGSKRSTVATDTVDFFEIPAFAGIVVSGASVSVVRPGTATSTIAVTLGAANAAGTAVTGLTAWAGDAAAGTKLVKLATAANSVISTTTSNFLKLQFGTAGAGTGRYRVRVFGTVMEAAPATP